MKVTKQGIVIRNLIQNESGVFSSKTASEAGIPRVYLSRLLEKGEIRKISRGLYCIDEPDYDQFYLFARRYGKGVFCRRTALYLHGLLNRPIDCIEANFPRSYNISNLKRSGVFAYNVSGIRYDFGISEVRTPSGFMVPCLDKERTICDMFLYDICDVEEKQYAMRTYLNGTDAQLDKLYSYAEKLKVEKQVIAATEVLI